MARARALSCEEAAEEEEEERVASRMEASGGGSVPGRYSRRPSAILPKMDPWKAKPVMPKCKGVRMEGELDKEVGEEEASYFSTMPETIKGTCSELERANLPSTISRRRGRLEGYTAPTA